MEIKVENIKCGGCSNTIARKIESLIGVKNCSVDVENGTVLVEGGSVNKVIIVKALAELGYPEIGTTHGIGKMAKKAKSFVSCMIGKTKGG